MGNADVGLLKNSEEMIEIFRAMPEKEKAVALAYALGQASQPLDSLFRLPSPEQPIQLCK